MAKTKDKLFDAVPLSSDRTKQAKVPKVSPVISGLEKYCHEGFEIQRNREGVIVRNKHNIIVAQTCPFTKDFCDKPEVEKGCMCCIYKESLGYETSPWTGAFIKKDSGKLKWSLLPFEELKDVVKVLMYGAEKYSPDNWKKCDDTTRYKDALMRHVVAYVSGEKIDEEFGLSHLAHAICNCLFLMWFDKHKGNKDLKKFMD